MVNHTVQFIALTEYTYLYYIIVLYLYIYFSSNGGVIS